LKTSGASTSAVARQTGSLLNQFLGSQFYYDTQKRVQGAESFEVFQKGLKEFHLNTGESHYESYKTHVKKVYNEVKFAWVSPPSPSCSMSLWRYVTITGRIYMRRDISPFAIGRMTWWGRGMRGIKREEEPVAPPYW
jgi:hypothetical protein